MNTSTLLGRPLLLVAVLAVSWAAAVPLQPLSGNTDIAQDAQTFFDNHPSVARELYPHLLNAASDVNLIVNRNVVLDLLRDYMALHSIHEEAQAEEEHQRGKRDTTFLSELHRQANANGHSVGGSGTLTHDLNDNFAISGTVGGTRQTIPGLGNLDTIRTGAGLHYSPNDDTTFSVGAHRVDLPFDRTMTGASATLENTWDNNGIHSLSGTLEANRHDTPGFDSFNSHRASLDYNYNIDRNTRLSVGGGSSHSPLGREGFFGINFNHMFGG